VEIVEFIKSRGSTLMMYLAFGVVVIIIFGTGFNRAIGRKIVQGLLLGMVIAAILHFGFKLPLPVVGASGMAIFVVRIIIGK